MVKRQVEGDTEELVVVGRVDVVSRRTGFGGPISLHVYVVCYCILFIPHWSCFCSAKC